MALLGTLSGQWGSTYRVEYSIVSQSIEGNYTIIRLTSIFHTTNTTTISSTYSNFITDGTTMYSGAYSKRGAGNVFAKTKDITIYHNADGTFPGREVSFSTNDYIMGSKSGKGTITGIPTIPRASTAKLTGSLLGSVITVAITRAVSTFTHTIEYSFEGSDWISVGTGIGVSKSFTPPITLATNIPNNTQGTLSVRVSTYNGSTLIGTSIATIVLSLPDTIVPTMGTPTAKYINNGIPTIFDVFIKGYSKALVSIVSANGIYGSTIKSYMISGAGFSSDEATLETDILKVEGTFEFKCTITDSRGRSVTKTVTIKVEDYYLPSATIVSAERCLSNGVISSSGTYLKITIDFDFASVAGKNSLRTKKVTCNGVSNTSFLDGVSFILAANCAKNQKYTVSVTITDQLNNSAEPVSKEIRTDFRRMNFNKKSNAVCFGGYATDENTFTVILQDKYIQFEYDPVEKCMNIRTDAEYLNFNSAIKFGSKTIKFANNKEISTDNLVIDE